MGFKYLALILFSVSVALAKFPEVSVDTEEIHLSAGSNCSDKAELSPAAVESLKNSIINEIKRNLTDIISNAVKDSFEKYLMSVVSSIESENSLIFSKLGPVIPSYYSTPRSYQNYTGSVNETIPHYYPTESQNSTEPSAPDTTAHYHPTESQNFPALIINLIPDDYFTRSQNSSVPINETIPHYYPTESQNSTEPSAPDTTAHYYPTESQNFPALIIGLIPDDYFTRSQNSSVPINETIPHYYPTESQNSTEPSVTETTPSYSSPTNQNSSESEIWEALDSFFLGMEEELLN